VSTIAMPAAPGGVAVNSFRNCTFRTNPDYEFVLLEQLPAQEQTMLGDLGGDPDFCGLLRPRLAAGLTTKAVSREIAKLLDILNEPGPLPTFITNDPEFELVISRLVCDGILQIARGAGWICGPAVWPADHSADEKSGGLLAEMSIRALQHAELLECSDAVELSALLYRYNTLPLTPQWLRRIPDDAALEEYLQIQSGGASRRDLDQGWTRVFTGSEKPGSQSPWLAWNSRTILRSQTNRAGYKLYLSPLPAHLREAFRVWLPATAGAYHFKIGSNVRGLLRPDKMVAYFDDLLALQESAQRITSELKGCPAQGVPFTVELDCDELISWGSDPPLEEAVPIWLRRQSWRQWICNRMGSALAVAKREKATRKEGGREKDEREGVADMTAWRFSLERLRLEGVDIATWAPISTIWQSKPAAEVSIS
jgi:hypothetical protein